MQFAVTDDAAAVFSRTFYQALVHNRGVDEAVRAGRIALTGWNPDTLEWVTPVLYLRSRDTRLSTSPIPARPRSARMTQLQPRREAVLAAYWAARSTGDWEPVISQLGALARELPGDREVGQAYQDARLAARYAQGQHAEQDRDWPSAVAHYRAVSDAQPEYRDVAVRLGESSRRRDIAALQEQLRVMFTAGEFQAVAGIAGLLAELDPSAADPDGLTTQARRRFQQRKADPPSAGPMPAAIPTPDTGPPQDPKAAPTPRLTVELRTAELPVDEWSILRGRISNIGEVDVSDLEITLSGQVTTKHPGRRFPVEWLPVGRSVDASFYVRVHEAGAHVSVHLDLAYSGPDRRHHDVATRTVKVSCDEVRDHRVAQNSGQPLIKILFLGANPRDTRALRLDEEIREIQQAIRLGKERDNIQVDIRWAVQPRDISTALLDIQPHFVHFAWHGGSEDGSFAAEDDLGNSHVIPVDGLVQLFKAVGQSVECVIVNASSTELLARGLSSVIPYVIGMRQPISDRSAIKFSTGFYQALSAGRPIEQAFDVGTAQMMMMPGGGDPVIPLLLRRSDRTLAAVRIAANSLRNEADRFLSEAPISPGSSDIVRPTHRAGHSALHNDHDWPSTGSAYSAIWLPSLLKCPP